MGTSSGSTRNKWVTLVGAALNTTRVLRGVNYSLADLGLLGWLLRAARGRFLLIPGKLLAVFCFFVSWLVFVSWVITPLSFNVPASGAAVVGAAAKLIVDFFYFVFGFNIIRLGHVWQFYRAYYSVAVAISVIGVISGFITPLSFVEPMFFASYRFMGLMVDPNFYAVQTVAALVALWADRERSVHFRLLCGVVLVIGVMASGSKTGVVTLLACLTWQLLHVIKSRYAAILVGVVSVVGATVVLATLLIDFDAVTYSLRALETQSPSLQRVFGLFTEGDVALEGSSARTRVWTSAMEIIGLSPVIGLGVGSYQGVVTSLAGHAGLAHNTYLQAAAEWGLLVAVVFFSAVLILVIRSIARDKSSAGVAARGMAIAFLVGSFGLSLNNARLFWVVLGALYWATYWATRQTVWSKEGGAATIDDNSSDQ